MTDTQSNGAPATTAEIAAEIEATRAALGDTVAALAAKADVKARLAEKVSETGADIATGVSQTAGRVVGILEALANRIRSNPLPWVLGATALLITLAAARSRRR
jgi:hypothetical protein